MATDLNKALSIKKLPFTVDSALLRELGERLVGRPHIALAELIKNSYDADAQRVVIRFDGNNIEVIDNGYGMSSDEFRDFWMRIGSPHKEEQRVSRLFKRPLTGSKGVGRLAVQFLASRIEIRTVSKERPKNEIIAYVDWDKAINAGELIKATASVKEIEPIDKFADDTAHGTKIILTGLNQEWNSADFESLAREIWSLQPPFRSNPEFVVDQRQEFSVSLETPNEEYAKSFYKQMKAAISQWEARIIGRLHKSGERSEKRGATVQVIVEFDDRTQYRYDFEPISDLVNQVEFEIRVFRLSNRLKQGVKVEEARDYFRKYGGVHIYDTGFHLPYYGPDTDWLDIERDHARRLTRSELLPADLQKPVKRGLNMLPSQRRLFGVVRINTNLERDEALRRGAQMTSQSRRKPSSDWDEIERESEKKFPHLKVQVTRDRLVDNEAFTTLSNIVRTALDYYSIVAQQRNQEELRTKPGEPAPAKFKRVEEVLSAYRREIPSKAFIDLKNHLAEAVEASETEAQRIAGHAGLLGSLATAGIAALAFDHELNKQMSLLEREAKDLSVIAAKVTKSEPRLAQIAQSLKDWVHRARETRSLFSHLTTDESRSERKRYKALSLIKEVEQQLSIYLRGIPIDTTGLREDLRLPTGTFAEWSAIFQNLFINAINAMIDSEKRAISISSSCNNQSVAILVNDTGCGVNLEAADELFEPFKRRLEISNERRNLGLGGTGLGLTIVRMIASNLDCRVRFIEPQGGFKTTFQISWTEK